MPNKIVVIHEECHGMIGLAYNYQRAIAFLWKEDWFDEEEMLAQWGVNWLERIKRWSIDDFNEEFDGCFQLEIREIFI